MFKNKLVGFSILSGILIGTSFIPFPPWASVFAFVPLWSYWLQTQSTKKVFWSGWICQLTLTLIGCNWIMITIHDFGNLPWVVAGLGFFAFSSFAYLYIPLSGLIYSLINKKIKLTTLQKLLLMALITSLLEPFVKSIFPWNFGYTWTSTPIPIFHNAEIIGFEGISSIIIWLNVLSFYFFSKATEKSNKLICALSIVFVLSVLTFSGYYLKSSVAETDKSVRIAIIQANIGDLAKQYRLKGATFRGQVIDEYLKLSKAEKLKNSPDIFIWPETAAPVKLGEFNRNAYNASLKQKLKKNKISLITGAYTTAETGQTTNSMIFFDEGNFISPAYDKTHLLAFGEYIPGSQFYPEIKTWIPQISDFKPGDGPQITTFKNIKIGAQICYESFFPLFAAGLSKLGAEMIINLTNDSWYDKNIAPKQHLYVTLARAIESRRPLIRSTNTGISTVILADGTILEQSPIDQVWAHTFDVDYSSNPEVTFYNKYPHLFLILKMIFIFSIVILGYKRKV